MCLPNFFKRIFSNPSETASSPDIPQSNRQQSELRPLSQQQGGGELITKQTTIRSKLSQQNQQSQPEIPPHHQQHQKAAAEEKKYFNGLFNKKKSIPRKNRTKPSGAGGLHKKRYSYGNVEHHNKAKLNETKMKKQTPSMQNDLNRGGFKAHVLMNKPPPADIKPARKSKQKVENTISISVHQPVDSDSDADLLNTDKKRSPAPEKKKKQQHGTPNRFTPQLAKPILPTQVTPNDIPVVAVPSVTPNEIMKKRMSNEPIIIKKEENNVEKTSETVPLKSPQSPLRINSQADDTDTDLTPQPVTFESSRPSEDNGTETEEPKDPEKKE